MRLMGFRKKFFGTTLTRGDGSVKALQEEHKKAFGVPINDLGYPDMGNGRYAQLLPYTEWYEFNNAQRGHYNMVESSAPVLATLLAGGLIFPKTSAGLGLAYAIGMILFSLGYSGKQGANGRTLGAMLRSVSSLALTAISFGFALKAFGVINL